MTANEMAKKIGKVGRWHVGGVVVNVDILDARRVFNRTDLCISPVAGTMTTWVSSACVFVDDVESPAVPA